MMDIVGELMGTDKRGDCPLHTWLDYLCTIHYVMENKVRRGATDDEIMKEVERCRGYPLYEEEARKAINVIRTMI